MLFGLLLDELTLADLAGELHTTGNRAVQLVTAPLWMALLSLYSLSTFFGIMAAGCLSKLAPSLFTPDLFEAVVDKVVPGDASYHVPSDLQHAGINSSSLGFSGLERGGKRCSCSSCSSCSSTQTTAMSEDSGSSLQVPQ